MDRIVRTYPKSLLVVSEGDGNMANQEMKRIDRSEIEKLLKAGEKGTIFLTVFYASPMDKAMRKTGNRFHGQGLLKECSINGCVGFDYEAAVNRLAEKEGKEKREAKARQWGVLDADRKFVRHTNKDGVAKSYLQIMCRSNTIPVFRLGARLLTDAEVAEVKTFIPEKEKSSTQEDLDGEVVLRDIDLNNILAIRVNGNHYLVADLEPLTTEEQVAKAKISKKFDEMMALQLELVALAGGNEKLEAYINAMFEAVGVPAPMKS